MKFRILAPALVACLLALAGCKDNKADLPAGSTPPPARTTPVSVDTIAAEARGFTVGQAMSARTIYVFFDPQCPHCAALWDASRPLRPQARWVWIPVGLLNGNSTPQGAALLAATDPVAAMDGHEASMRNSTGGIRPMGDLDAQKAAVEGNTKLLDRFQFSSVPTLVAAAPGGGVTVKEGSLPTAELAAAFGLQVPGK